MKLYEIYKVIGTPFATITSRLYSKNYDIFTKLHVLCPKIVFSWIVGTYFQYRKERGCNIVCSIM